MTKLKICCYLLAFLFVAFAIIPFGYRIYHVGSGILFLLGLAAIILPTLLVKARSSAVGKALVVGAYSLAIGVIIAFSTFMAVKAYANPPPDTNQPYTLVILGAKVEGDRPTNMLRYRLNKGAEYLKANENANVIVSGGQGIDEAFPEALVMKNYLISIGIDESRITAEDKSTNTRENLEFSQKLMPKDSAGTIIVTDGYHQARAGMVAKNLGLAPCYSIPSRSAWGLIPAYWFRDMAAIPVYWLREKLN